MTISGKEFNTPLTFTFPGREVRDVTVIDGAVGYAQTGDVTTAPPGTLQSVALNGLSGSFGNIGRAKKQLPVLDNRIHLHQWSREWSRGGVHRLSI